MDGALLQHPASDSYIAIVASACEFPDASSPAELWQSVLNRRRAFRRIPAERLRMDPYLRLGGEDPDGLYPIEAALIKDYAFDRAAFRIPHHTFEATDLAHWLALDVATRALRGLPGWGDDEQVRDTTSVVVANTLNGEFSRSTLMRGRWPFVSNCLQRVLANTNLPEGERACIVSALELTYKSAFPSPSEDTLAGGLANTIAGRISNFHGLRGGAYTIDGACASSLLAVANACGMLRAGDASCAVVGGVDLSIDPFELIGFARNSALARDEMRVFDAASNGFWPGEGCGFIVLATAALAHRQGWPVLGWLRGWGISTDGYGGLTRPTVAGQRLALQRAYRRAGLNPCGVGYFEAHGTGTPTGDPVELQALTEELAAGGSHRSRPIGSIKANVGHTKAAAGMAGLLNALAISTARVAPALAGLRQPHALLSKEGVRDRLHVLHDNVPLDATGPILVGVSGFGFGGVNAHAVIEGPASSPAWAATRLRPDCDTLRSDLFLLSASTPALLAERIQPIIEAARNLSRAEMGDLAAALAAQDSAPVRAFVIADTPQQLEARLSALQLSLASDTSPDTLAELPHGWRTALPHGAVIAFVFSGQGQHLDADAANWKRRLPHLGVSWDALDALLAADRTDTAVLQCLLAEIGIAGTSLLKAVGLAPSICLGHSFGELTALHAAGAYDADTFRAMAKARGDIMRSASTRPGAMARVALPAHEARILAERHGVDVACLNGPASVVLSGSANRVAGLLDEIRATGIEAASLPSQVAFHSREMRDAAQPFGRFVTSLPVRAPICAVASTITGSVLDSEDLSELLASQITSPVRLTEAANHLAPADLVIEVGAGEMMTSLLDGLVAAPCVSLGLFGTSLQPTLCAIAQAWMLGATVRLDPLFDGRGVRPFDVLRQRSFFSNPCDRSAGPSMTSVSTPTTVSPTTPAPMPELGFVPACVQGVSLSSPLAIEQRLRVALTASTGLPDSAIAADTRMLSDLHMNSLRVRHVVTQVARDLAIQTVPFELAELANAPLSKLVEHLHSLGGRAAAAQSSAPPQGITPWVRAFSLSWSPATESMQELDLLQDMSASAVFHGKTWPIQAIRSQQKHDETRCDHWHFFHARKGFGRDDLPGFLADVQAALRDERCAGLLFLQTESRLDGFVRSLAKEHPRRAICLLTVPHVDEIAVRAAFTLANTHDGLVERCLAADGILHQPVFSQTGLDTGASCPLPGPADAVLVTGGAKGIGAEVAQWFAQRGCRIALIGRAAADDDSVRTTLERLRCLGSTVAYASADLRDTAATAHAVIRLQSSVGPISHLVHAAGVNQPCPVDRLEADEFMRTVDTKVASLRHLLAAFPTCGGPTNLVSFGSIISEIGLPGEAHYALANQWLNQAVHEWFSADPSRKAWALCWTAWRDVGMATRLEGVLDELDRHDTRALSTQEALRTMEEALASAGRAHPLVLCGRHGLSAPSASVFEGLKYRFLETPRVFYPGVELVVDAQVRADTDRYLNDHAPYGVRVFPAVFAIEAMVQCAQALTGHSQRPVIEGFSIAQPITLSHNEAVTLRNRALVQDDGAVRVDILCSSSGFAVTHFQARLAWSVQEAQVAEPLPKTIERTCAAALYGNLLFHGPMFRALDAYQGIHALSCSAELRAVGNTRWYSALMPSHFACGDPALRDAMIHCLQACVPHATVLPVSAERIEMFGADMPSSLTVRGRETWRDERDFLFDVEAVDEGGHVVERWTGLRLRRVAPAGFTTDPMRLRALPTSLLAPFVERLSHGLAWPVAIQAGVDAGDGRRSQRRQRALTAALGAAALLSHDKAGAPRVRHQHVSVSHDDKLSLVVASSDLPIGCDFQRALACGDDEWPGILGPDRLLTAQALSCALQEPLRLSALRVWTATETLIKIGRPDWPLRAEHWRGEPTDLGVTASVCADGVAIVTSSFRLVDDAAPCMVAVGVALPVMTAHTESVAGKQRASSRRTPIKEVKA